MALSLSFVPPFPPLEPVEDNLQIRRIDAQFGDGYVQSVADGLNAEPSNVQLTFEPLTLAQYQSMDGFFQTIVDSGLCLSYKLPIDSAVKYWWPQVWTPTRQDAYYSLQVTLIQVFPPGD